MSKRQKLNATLLLGDIHCPYHHVPSMSLVFAVLDRFEFKDVWSAGDICDGKGASRHNPTGLRQKAETLLYEIDCTEWLASQIQRAAGVPCGITLGNHDMWPARYLASHPSLGLPRDFSVPKRLKDLGWSVVKYQRSKRLTEHVDLTHDFGHAGKMAFTYGPSRYGKNVLFGHVHRAGVYYEGSTEGKLRFSAALGWLGDPDQIEYAHSQKVKAETVHGVGLLYYGSGGRAHYSFSPFFQDAGSLWACIHGEWISVSQRARDARCDTKDLEFSYEDPGSHDSGGEDE